MIKFYRKIRYNLMSENKTGRYLKYAIGEIILVVIGILIALQVNNWNQKLMEKKEAQILLKNLRNDFQNDTIQLKKHIDFTQLQEQNIDSIAILLKNAEQRDLNRFIKLQSSIYNFRIFQSNQSTYDEAISSGKLMLLDNINLKNNILSYYREINRDNNDKVMTKLRDERILPYLNDNIFNTKEISYELFGTENNLPSLNLKMLSSNQDYFGILVTSKGKSFQVNSWKRYLNMANEILEELNNEIIE